MLEKNFNSARSVKAHSYLLNGVNQMKAKEYGVVA